MSDGSQPIRIELVVPVEAKKDDETRGIVGGMWTCGFRICRGGDVVAQGEGVGSDALESIVNAIPSLRAAYAKTGFVARWNEYLPGTGLPAFLPQGFGVEFDEHVEKLVKNAVEARALELEQEHRRFRED
jgi:hypothetical protein